MGFSRSFSCRAAKRGLSKFEVFKFSNAGVSLNGLSSVRVSRVCSFANMFSCSWSFQVFKFCLSFANRDFQLLEFPGFQILELRDKSSLKFQVSKCFDFTKRDFQVSAPATATLC